MAAGGVWLSVSQASREAYHNYLLRQAGRVETREVPVATQSERPLRTFAGGLRSHTVRTSSDNAANLSAGYKPLNQGRYLNSRGNWNRSDRPKTKVATSGVYRPFSGAHNYHFGPSQGSIQSLTLSAVSLPGSVEYDLPELKTFIAPEFSFSVPKASSRQLVVGDKDRYVFSYDDAEITVDRYPNSCGETGFVFCASNISRNVSRSETFSQITSQKEREARVKAVIYGDTVSYTETMQESFLMQEGAVEYFVSYYFVKGTDNDIFLLTLQAPRNKASRYLQLNKEMIDSFRLEL